MNALVVLSAVLASASASLVAPYAAAYAPGYATYGAAVPYAAAPVAAPLAAPVPAPVAPITAPSSQFQAQDEFGNLNYGYSNINSAKQEIGNAYGGVTGSYSYVDANGIPQRVDYIADALGFRVKATNLPVAPATPLAAPLEAPVFTGVAPAPVQDTAEVAAAKAEFRKAFDEAANREKRSADPEALYGALPYNALNLWNNYAYNGLYGYNAPLTYAATPAVAATYATPAVAATYATPALAAAPIATAAVAPIATPAVAATYAAPAPAVVAAAPAAREAILTKIKLNPGHAIAYRVD